MRSCVCFLTVVLASAFLAVGAPHKVRVSDPAIAASLEAQSARLVAGYGGFLLLEAGFEAAAAGVEVVDDFDVIHLNARPLNTRDAAVQALRRPAIGFN